MPSDPIATLLAALPQPALLITGAERITGANARAEKLLGATPLVGRHLITVIRQPPVLEAVERCNASGKAQRARLLTSEGRNDLTYQVHCGAVDLPGISGVLVSFEDVTQAAIMGQMRRDFVANVSHELRTPLTALIGFIETLQGPAANDPAARERFLAIMSREAGRMNRLVSDLLSLSQVESEARVRPTQQVDISALVNGTLRSLAPLAEKSDVTLLARGSDTPHIVQGDEDQLRQVLTNLIENAIKYGGTGKTVDISLSALENDPSLRRASVRIEVRDQGPGIDPLHLPRLTERFYRVDSHRSREVGGTGLGLAIVKHIINRHRGRLAIRSTLGEGSTFVVSLPQTA